MNKPITALGLCVGASSVSLVRVRLNPTPPSSQNEDGRPVVIDHLVQAHDGNPKQALLKTLTAVNWGEIDRVAATGRKFRQFLNLSSIPEPEAVEYAYDHLKPSDVHCPAVISAGGETFMVYELNPAGRITNVLTGNKWR